MSINFDRIADRYDETRGGTERGRLVAGVIREHLPADGPLLEIGVGTGLVAMTMGARLIGVDISSAMLDVARPRVPGRLAQADAAALPFRDGTFAGGYAVWVIHLVEDPVAVLAEVRRAFRTGAPFVIETAPTYPVAGDPIQTILQRLYDAVARRARPDVPDRLAESAAAAGASIEHVATRESTFEQTPLEVADSLESRAGSAFWHLTPAQWEASMVPALAALRALPNPDEPRTCVAVDTTVVLSMG